MVVSIGHCAHLLRGIQDKTGRPMMNWRDVVKKDLQRMGSTWEEVEASAQDRHLWRQRVALYASVMLDESSQSQSQNLWFCIYEYTRKSVYWLLHAGAMCVCVCVCR